MSNQTVGTSAVAVAVPADTGVSGQVVLLQNLGAGDLYFDFTNAVTAASGIKVAANGVLELALNGNDLYVIASSAGTDLRILAVG